VLSRKILNQYNVTMIRTRIAPSPTGEDIHIGNLYTALINWVFAKKNHGKFVVRIEDTDRIRLIEGAEKRILQSLEDYGIVPDESSIVGGAHGPYRQSERLPIYKKYAEELVESGKAYYCFCSKERLDMLRAQAQEKKQISKYDKYCFKNVKLEDAKERIKKGEKYVIRMHIPEGTEIAFDDLIRGTITFHSKDIDDQILLKSDGYPTYHLAVVVDDHLMEISHVIRAEEWISSTPKHIFLYNAFGWELPVFAHVPILRNPNRSKLSKRKNPVWASWYLDQGFLPEAVLNYLALMGWSHPKQKEIFSMEEFIREFELKDVSAVGPAFDVVKLEWMNGEYLRKLRIENLELRIQNYVGRDYDRTIITKTIPLIQERIKKLSDYLPLCEFFFKRPEKYELDLSEKKGLLKKIHLSLQEVREWKASQIGEIMQNLAKKEGVKNSEFFMVLRVAITGKKISPPLNESMEVLGKEECVERLKRII